MNYLVTDRLKNEFVIPCEVKDRATGTRVAQLPKTLVTERNLIVQKRSVRTKTKRDINQMFCEPTMNLAGGIPNRSLKYLGKSSICKKRKKKGHLNATGA